VLRPRSAATHGASRPPWAGTNKDRGFPGFWSTPCTVPSWPKAKQGGANEADARARASVRLGTRRRGRLAIAVPQFLVEVYVPTLNRRARSRMIAAARAAAAAETHERAAVRHVRAIYVPEDETCFHLFEAPSADVVERVVAAAGLACTRISETAR
jgi:hypothetical protein